jgi:hypothetical protein
MSGRLDEDLARWEAGELTLPELEDRYPEGHVRELLSLHDRLVDLTLEETPDPEPGWEAMRPRLRPRRIPTRWIRVGRRAHRPAVIAAAAVLLAGGLAFAAEPVRQVVARVLGDVIELIRPGDASSQLASSVKDISARGMEDTSIRWTPSVENVDDELTCSTVTSPSHGIVTVVSDCSGGSYIPDPDFNGTDSFTYGVADPVTAATTATVTITVEAVNDAPVAGDDDATTWEDTAVTIDVLGNDSDVDGDSLTVESATGATNGSVTIAGDGSVTYTPDLDFHGTDSFTYTVDDASAEPTVATVNVTVEPVSDAPVAGDDDATTREDTAVTIDVLGNDSDIEGDSLKVDSATNGTNGSVTTAEDGSVTYTPAPDFHGTDSFTYAVADSTGAHTMATVTITVEPVNDAPVADDASIAGEVDASIPWTPSASDVDQDVLTCSITTPPTHGSVTVNADCSGGSYTPDPNYSGPDSNAYGVSDGKAGDTATLTVEVSPVNEPPPTPP